MVSGILVELHSQHLCVGLISLDELKTCPVDRYRSDAALVFPSDLGFCNVFRPPLAAAYRQSSPTQSPETGCVGRCLQTVFCVRRMLQHLRAPKPR